MYFWYLSSVNRIYILIRKGTFFCKILDFDAFGINNEELLTEIESADYDLLRISKYNINF